MDSIPHGWKVIRFDDFTTLQRGKDLTKSQFKAGSIPVAGSNGIIGYHNESFVKAPGVTVGRSGSCGKVKFYAVDFWAHNTSLYVRDFHGNDERFASYLLGFLDLSRFRTGASVPTLDRNSFKELPTAVPEVDEQRRIAHVLSTAQTAIEQQRRLITLTRELKSALMRKLFTEGLRGEKQKEMEIGLVPESWEVVKIGTLGKCVTGTTPKTSVEEYYMLAEYDFIAPADLGNTRDIYNSEKKISRKGLEVIRSLPKNAVMCVCIGSSIGKVGMTWKDESATNQQINSIVCNQNYNPQFIYYLLLHYLEYWRRFATFGTVPILNKNRFEGIEIPVTTNREEQDKIANILSRVDTKIENHSQKKIFFEELFRTLLDQLMTGQIRVNELEI